MQFSELYGWLLYSGFEALREQGYSNAFHQDQYTDVTPENPEGKKNKDNIWLGKHASNYATGSIYFLMRVN